MSRSRGNDYAAVLPVALPAGLYEYVVSTETGQRVVTFPGAAAGQPFRWPFRLAKPWTFRISPAGTAVRLLNPKVDYGQLSFVRPGEQYRDAFFQLAPAESTDESALTLDLPELGQDTPQRYAAALYIGDALASHRSEASRADAIAIKLRSHTGSRKRIEVTLVEQDGTAWSTVVPSTTDWTTVRVPLVDLHLARSIHIPSPYPGLWNYWRDAAQGRGSQGDHIYIENVERLQLTVTPNGGERVTEDAKGVTVESIKLTFATDPLNPDLQKSIESKLHPAL
jgi:hypothetical protein